MGTITPPSLIIGDAISSQPINTFIKSVNAFTVAADNIRPEGIDRRNIQSQITHDKRKINLSLSTPLEVSSSSFQKIQSSSHSLSFNSMSVNKDEMYHICASFNFFTDENDNLNGNSNGGLRSGPSPQNGPIQVSFMIGADQTFGNTTVQTQLSQTRKDFRVISSREAASAVNFYHENANCCTMQLMDKVTQDTTFDFYLLGKATALGQGQQPKVFIDSISFFYVRYLV